MELVVESSPTIKFWSGQRFFPRANEELNRRH